MISDCHISTFILHLEEVIPLTEKDKILLSNHLELVKLNKKENLLEPGQVSRHLRFIAKGTMRSYYLDKNSQEHTLQLGIENWWINDLYSFLTEKPSRMYVQAIEASVVLQINNRSLEVLYEQIPGLSTFFRLKIQAAYIALQERTIENMSEDAYERYQNFLTQYREMEQRVPQYMVASYLGITPEFLSYLRNKHRKSIS